jgi:hypothetical protein
VKTYGGLLKLELKSVLTSNIIVSHVSHSNRVCRTNRFGILFTLFRVVANWFLFAIQKVVYTFFRPRDEICKAIRDLFRNNPDDNGKVFRRET